MRKENRKKNIIYQHIEPIELRKQANWKLKQNLNKKNGQMIFEQFLFFLIIKSRI